MGLIRRFSSFDSFDVSKLFRFFFNSVVVLVFRIILEPLYFIFAHGSFPCHQCLLSITVLLLPHGLVEACESFHVYGVIPSVGSFHIGVVSPFL